MYLAASQDPLQHSQYNLHTRNTACIFFATLLAIFFLCKHDCGSFATHLAFFATSIADIFCNMTCVFCNAYCTFFFALDSRCFLCSHVVEFLVWLVEFCGQHMGQTLRDSDLNFNAFYLLFCLTDKG